MLHCEVSCQSAQRPVPTSDCTQYAGGAQSALGVCASARSVDNELSPFGAATLVRAKLSHSLW